jgi:hypothetical protein
MKGEAPQQAQQGSFSRAKAIVRPPESRRAVSWQTHSAIDRDLTIANTREQ